MSTRKSQSKSKATYTILSAEEMIKWLTSEGYTVYAWKEGFEEIPKGLQHYIEALSDKKAQEKIEQYNEVKGKDNVEQNSSSNCIQPVGPRDIMETASKIVMGLQVFRPNEQNKVIDIATGLIAGIRDGHIKELRRRKDCIDRAMKDLNDELSDYINSQDELMELKK